MARKKLTEDEKIQLQNQKKEKSRIATLAYELDDLRKKAKYFSNPTYSFEVGEEVIWGNHKNTKITEVLDGGLIYKTYSDYMGESYGKPVPVKIEAYHSWLELRRISGYSQKVMGKAETYRLNYYQTGMSGLLVRIYSFGVDFNPEYQRDHVWDLQDKVDLIESIFNRIDIGKFVFIQRESSVNGELYEIMDGKQRLSAIREFYEDRFKWRGLTFSQLHPQDKAYFTNLAVSVADISDCSLNQKIEIFLKINTHGKVMDKAHLESVKAMLK